MHYSGPVYCLYLSGDHPHLMTYMDRDVKKVRISIILGTSIPLLVYLVWETLILGIVPIEGPGGLLEAKRWDKQL